MRGFELIDLVLVNEVPVSSLEAVKPLSVIALKATNGSTFVIFFQLDSIIIYTKC